MLHMDMHEFPREPFTRATALQAGINSKRLYDATEAGILRRPVRGVFVRADVPDTVEARAAAALCVTGVHTVITDRTAAWIHGVDVFDSKDRDMMPAVEMCALRQHSPTRRGGVDARTRDLLCKDIMQVAGLRLTTPLRTALDLGCMLRRREALAAMDQFARLHGVTRGELSGETARYFRRRGVVQLRALIPLVEPGAESPRESWTRLALIEAGLPTPVLQHEVEASGSLLYRLDLAYPFHRVAIEYDGWEFHHRNEEQLLHDEERREWLAEHGWRVIVVRSGDFSGPGLDRWLGEVKRALASAYSGRRW